MALKQANTLAPSNVSASGFALADARHIGGHRVVASLAALYALQDWQLLNPDEKDTDMALGQQWYVKSTGFYRLTNWANRKAAAGWTKVVDPNNIDTTLFQIVTDLPTTGINKNRIYLKKSASSTTQDIYDEFIYTGDTSAAYDASKWEKLGEYKPEVELTWDKIKNKPATFTPSAHTHTPAQVGLGNVSNVAQIPLSQKGAANGVATLDASGKVTDGQLWDATEGTHGLMSAADKKNLDALAQDKTDGTIMLSDIDLTADKISAYAKAQKPTRLNVTVKYGVTGGVYSVGVLEIYSDNMEHVLVQVFKTSLVPQGHSVTSQSALDESFSNFDNAGHSDGKIYAYRRFYNINSGYEEATKGTWSKWEVGSDDLLYNTVLALADGFVYDKYTATANSLPLKKDSSSNGYVDITSVNTAISAKVATSTYNTKMSALDAKNTAQDTAIAGKVDKTDIEIMTTAEVDALFA